MTLEIRPVTQSDFAEWKHLWTAYLAFYETELSDAVKETAFARLLDPAAQSNGLLALEGGRPVGLVHYIFHEHMWKPEGAIYLQDLYAEPSVRGKGVGRALIEAVYAAADKAGVPSVHWLTQDNNATARLLYDRIAKLSPFVRYVRG